MNAHRRTAAAARIAALLTLAGLASACSSGPTVTGAACLPEAARRWVASAPASDASNAGGPVDVYVDASGSMVGYLRGADASRRPFQDLLTELRAATMAGPQTAVTRTYRLFGRTIRTLPASQVDSLLQPDTYLCTGATESCDNQESRLDLVLRQAQASAPNTLTVVVTDLWLSAARLEASGPVAVGAPVAEMLGQGRSLGVLGVASPYQGQIYDLPSGGPMPWSGDRPLYVLLIGPAERVVAFRENLARAGLRGFGRREARWSLFTSDPVAPGQGGQPTTSGSAFSVRPVLPPASGIRAFQATLSTGAALRERLRAPETPQVLTYQADFSTLRDGAVWQGPTEGVTRVWRLNGDPCDPRGWAPLADAPGRWEGEGASRTFTLQASEAATRFPRGGTYLIEPELRRVGLTTPNPANAWMRQWSFNASTEPQVREHTPAAFPTLNLAETAQILEAAAEQGARRRPAALAGFVAVVRSDD